MSSTLLKIVPSPSHLTLHHPMAFSLSHTTINISPSTPILFFFHLWNWWRKKIQCMLALVMENPYHAPTAHGDDGSRLSLGFPLGTALLLLLIFILSGIFSCVCHWEKIRSLRPAAAAAGMDLDGGNTLAPSTSKPTNMVNKHIFFFKNLF